MAKTISPAKKASPFFPRGTYVTGFCATGAHEGIGVVKSAAGAVLKPCKGEYSVPTTHYYGRQVHIKCTCSCHQDFEEIRAMMAAMSAMHEIPTLTPPRRIQETPGHTDTPTPVERPAVATTAPVAAPPRDGLLPFQRAAVNAIEKGHARRGVLEEKVRQVVEKYHELAAGMLTPKVIALYIDKNNPPSAGAVDAVMKRWESKGWVILGKKPNVIQTVTEIGLRNIVKK